MKNFITISFLLLGSASLSAQSTLHQNMYWLRFQNQLVFFEKLTWINEIENRRFLNPDAQNQLIGHTHLHYTIRNFEPAAGCSFSWQYTQEPEIATVLVVPEIRPFQELTYHIPLSKKIELQERLRIDERFTRSHTATELTDGYDFLFRFRFRTQFSYKLKNNYTFKLSNEIMFNDRRNTFDQNRIYLSIDKKLGKSFGVEASYVHIYQMRSNNKGYFSREIARLSVFYRILIKRKSAIN